MKYIYVDGQMHSCEGCGALVLRLDEPRHDAFHERVDVVPLGTIDTAGKVTVAGSGDPEKVAGSVPMDLGAQVASHQARRIPRGSGL